MPHIGAGSCAASYVLRNGGESCGRMRCLSPSRAIFAFFASPITMMSSFYCVTAKDAAMLRICFALRPRYCRCETKFEVARCFVARQGAIETRAQVPSGNWLCPVCSQLDEVRPQAVHIPAKFSPSLRPQCSYAACRELFVMRRWTTTRRRYWR